MSREALAPSALTVGIPGLGPLRVVGAQGSGPHAVVADASLDVLAPLRHPQPGTMEALARIARAHGSTVTSLAQSGPVLPLPLGTLLADDAAVRDVLRRRADELRHELDRLAGHAEWEVTVHLTASRVDADHEPAECEPEGGLGASSQRRHLEARGVAVAARRGRRRQRHALADEIHSALAAHAVEARRLDDRAPDRSPPLLLRSAYLVADTATDGFHETLAHLRQRCPDGVVDVTGPWPAYHFLTVDLGLPGPLQ